MLNLLENLQFDLEESTIKPVFCCLDYLCLVLLFFRVVLSSKAPSAGLKKGALCFSQRVNNAPFSFLSADTLSLTCEDLPSFYLGCINARLLSCEGDLTQAFDSPARIRLPGKRIIITTLMAGRNLNDKKKNNSKP